MRRPSNHTLRHSALATAVRVKIIIDALEGIDPQYIDSDLMITRNRMCLEIDKWSETEDEYALGIMAPLSALGKLGWLKIDL